MNMKFLKKGGRAPDRRRGSGFLRGDDRLGRRRRCCLRIILTAPRKAAGPSFWGDWTFGGEEGGLSVTTADSTQDWPKIITGVDEGWTDYVIEMDLENVAEGGVIFRSNNPVAGPDGFGGYYIGCDSAYMFAGMDDNGTWKILPDDGPEAPAAAALPYAVSMHWKIVVQGDTFTAYVDDMNTPFCSGAGRHLCPGRRGRPVPCAGGRHQRQREKPENLSA